MKRKPHSEAFHRIASGLEDAIRWVRGKKTLTVREVEQLTQEAALKRIRERKRVERTGTHLSAEAILAARDAERDAE